MTRAAAPRQAGFDHPALFYRSGREYRDELVPFIVDGLDRREPVAVAVPGPNLGLLRDSLGSAAERVTLVDMAEAGGNPGRIIPGVLREFADAYPDRHVRIVGEPIWPERDAHEYPACAQHEALINMAFAGRDVTIVCPYDATRLDGRALADAELTHPVLWRSGRRTRSGSYDPDTVIATYNHHLDTAQNAESLDVHAPAGLSAARRFAVHEARLLGLSPKRVDDLLFIVTELVTNSLVHADGGCRLSVWRDRDDVVCAVRDRGHLTDPLAGRRPVRPDQLGGRGLLLVNHLADLVRVHTSPHGTTVQTRLRLGRTGSDSPAAT